MYADVGADGAVVEASTHGGAFFFNNRSTIDYLLFYKLL
jgi:hypothetical protein